MKKEEMYGNINKEILDNLNNQIDEEPKKYLNKKEEEKMEQELKDQIFQDIINYYAGCRISENYTEAQKEIIASYESEFYKLPCDPEGLTTEQEKQLDNFVYKIVKEVMECKK